MEKQQNHAKCHHCKQRTKTISEFSNTKSLFFLNLNVFFIFFYLKELLVYKFVPGDDGKSTDSRKIETKNTSNIAAQISKDIPPKCPALRKPSQTLSLNLTETPDEPLDIARVEQSPLAFQSGHFDSDSTASPLTSVEINEIKQQPPPKNKGSDSSSKSNTSTDQGADQCDDVFSADTSVTTECNKNNREGQFGYFKLLWQQSFPEPVFAIDSLDTTGDGLEELVVLTQKGIHILQVGVWCVKFGDRFPSQFLNIFMHCYFFVCCYHNRFNTIQYCCFF